MSNVIIKQVTTICNVENETFDIIIEQLKVWRVKCLNEVFRDIDTAFTLARREIGHHTDSVIISQEYHYRVFINGGIFADGEDEMVFLDYESAAAFQKEQIRRALM